MRRFRHALVLGKFYPPHAGHHHVIRTAAEASERTTVAVLAATMESIPLADRVYRLAEEHWADPGVAVLGDIDDHPIDLHDDAIWELHVGIARAVLARRAIRDGEASAAAVDAVFSSEEYGDELAARLGATNVRVDPDRSLQRTAPNPLPLHRPAHVTPNSVSTVELGLPNVELARWSVELTCRSAGHS